TRATRLAGVSSPDTRDLPVSRFCFRRRPHELRREPDRAIPAPPPTIKTPSLRGGTRRPFAAAKNPSRAEHLFTAGPGAWPPGASRAARARRRGDRMSTRRDFITLLGGAATWPVVARAQQVERMRRIGVLMGGAGTDPVEQARLAAFLGGLEQLGWTDGR